MKNTNTNLGTFLKEVGDKFIFTGVKMEAYIPKSFEDRGLFEQGPDFCRTFGFFRIKVYDSNDKSIIDTMTCLPTTIYIYPSYIKKDSVTLDSLDVQEKVAKPTSLEDIEDMEEANEGVPERYIICTFLNGDAFTKTGVVADTDEVELFLSMLFTGKIKGISYVDQLRLWHTNARLNKVDLGIPSCNQEAILREINRNPKKPEETFGYYINHTKNASMLSYRPANIREVCARNSTFSAITFEDMDAMLTYSINRAIYNKTEKESPIEKVIKM